MAKEITITSEEDAYELLEQIGSGKAIALEDVKFDGWPHLEIRLVGPQFQQSLTPPVMRAMLDYQAAIYRAYAIERYNTPNTRHLTQDERDAFEIRVVVGKGSSELDINLQELLMKLAELLANKVDAKHVVALAISIGLMLTGRYLFREWMESRKEIRLAEVQSAERVEFLEAQKFLSGQETQRLKLVTAIPALPPLLLAAPNVEAKQTPAIEQPKSIAEQVLPDSEVTKLQEIADVAYDARTSIVKACAEAEKAEIQDIPISGDLAQELVTNARRHSEEVNLDGDYRILKVDASNADRFEVTVVKPGLEQFTARVPILELTQTMKRLLQRAEWDRKPVHLKVQARRIETEIRSAYVLAASRAKDEKKTK